MVDEHNDLLRVPESAKSAAAAALEKCFPWTVFASTVISSLRGTTVDVAQGTQSLPSSTILTCRQQWEDQPQCHRRVSREQFSLLFLHLA